MKVLLLGYSDIARRRVIPALASLDQVRQIDIASRAKPAPDTWPKKGTYFADYDDALKRSDSELAYISLPNSLHESWILTALEAGRHVIADKPATTTLASARLCAERAYRAGRLLAEATVFTYHPHIAAMAEFFHEHGPLTHIDAQFIIPPLPPENFRTSRALGGGCLLDMGPYAAAIARLFGSGGAQMAAFASPSASGDSSDTGFSLAAQFDNGVRYCGHFSFEAEYQNRLFLIGRSASLAVERLFSPPPNVEITWHTRQANTSAEVRHPPADTFRRFLDAAFQAIYTSKFEKFASDLIADAVFRDRLAHNLHPALG